jgi:hypothetical protein
VRFISAILSSKSPEVPPCKVAEAAVFQAEAAVFQAEAAVERVQAQAAVERVRAASLPGKWWFG